MEVFAGASQEAGGAHLNIHEDKSCVAVHPPLKKAEMVIFSVSVESAALDTGIWLPHRTQSSEGKRALRIVPVRLVIAWKMAWRRRA